MGWDIACYIAGAVSIIGPVGLVFWYYKAAKKQIRGLNKGWDQEK